MGPTKKWGIFIFQWGFRNSARWILLLGVLVAVWWTNVVTRWLRPPVSLTSTTSSPCWEIDTHKLEFYYIWWKCIADCCMFLTLELQPVQGEEAGQLWEIQRRQEREINDGGGSPRISARTTASTTTTTTTQSLHLWVAATCVVCKLIQIPRLCFNKSSPINNKPVRFFTYFP